MLPLILIQLSMNLNVSLGEELSVSVAASTTGAVGSEPAVITESVDVVEGMSPGAALLARAAWCLAAYWRFFSFSAGPQ